MKNEMNPNRVIVETNVYEASHGKMPRGKGMWAFSSVQYPDDVSNSDTVFFTNGTYAEAKKAAQCRFASRVVIYVQP